MSFLPRSDRRLLFFMYHLWFPRRGVGALLFAFGFFFGCCLGLLAVAGGSISGGAVWDSDDFFGASGEGADFFSQNVSFIRKSEVCRSLCSIGKGINYRNKKAPPILSLISVLILKLSLEELGCSYVCVRQKFLDAPAFIVRCVCWFFLRALVSHCWIIVWKVN